MKYRTPFGIGLCVVLSSYAFAFHPVNGVYFGILGEVSHGPSSNQVTFREDDLLFNGKVEYSPISGGAGAMFGYRYLNFRGELEFLYNWISTGPLIVGTCVLQSPDVLTPTGSCPSSSYDNFQSKGLGYSGSSVGVFYLANFYWTFFNDEHETPFAPYLGVGVGHSDIKNSSDFVNTVRNTSHGNSISTTGIAMQGILGGSYYMDDLTWLTMDYRFLTTNHKANSEVNVLNTQNKNYTLNTINLTVNFTFDKGARKMLFPGLSNAVCLSGSKLGLEEVCTSPKPARV